MRGDWIGRIAFLAACCTLAGFGAWTGQDQAAGRRLMVIGAIVLLLTAWLAFSRTH